jgi:hypothetical protein
MDRMPDSTTGRICEYSKVQMGLLRVYIAWTSILTQVTERN